ncbi:DUF551 domain-containing protein [Acinetobacter baumannii]|uniref:DUF551 domain-containing protein n=1 Tax=Acinetobacter baumannii TaxID=470 RepID=UPI0020CCF631|nr:DUF551 domain-containing protein [Acinetobacter baumannii]MCQ1053537.1 DUF551 domain-containing protein [Acinetobacter baumannii]
MIDLELERKAFEELSYKNGVRNFTKDDVDGGYCSAELDYNWHIWIKSAESKQAEIDALKAQLEQLDKVWISVDFMLPNEGEKVLIMIGDEQTVAEKCNVFGFIDVIDREALRTDLITYWMPLPKPPVKEAEGG